MRDESFELTDLMLSPWERLAQAARAELGPAWGSDQLALGLRWIADSCAAAASRAVAETCAVPEVAADEVSEAFDDVAYPRTIRVASCWEAKP